MTIRGNLLRQAADLTEKTREDVYGDPYINMGCASELKQVYRRYAGEKYSAAHDEAVERLLMKLARIATGDFHKDNYLDGAAYLAIAAECEQRKRLPASASANALENGTKPANCAHDCQESLQKTGNNPKTETYAHDRKGQGTR